MLRLARSMSRRAGRTSMAAGVALLGVLWTRCSPTDSPTAPPVDRRGGEVAVYRALIDSRYRPSSDTSPEIFVQERFAVLDTTYQAELMQSLRDSVPGLPESAVTSFLSVQSDHSLVPPLAVPHGRVHVVDEATMRAFFGPRSRVTRGWNGFREAFPHGGGIISLSRAGLSDDGSWAIMYAGQQSDWLEGAGFYYVLRYDGREWRVVHERMVWVS